MKSIQQAIFDSQQRVANFKDAVVFGFFGYKRNEVIENVKTFHSAQANLIENECREINEFIDMEKKAHG